MKIIKLFFLISQILITNYSVAQPNSQLYKRIYLPKDTLALYLGDVDGVTAKEYKKLWQHSKSEDAILGLKDLTKSKYDIEIRLYEEPDVANLIQVYYCTRLFLDTVFKLERLTKTLNYTGDSLKFISIDKSPFNLLNPDSIFILFAKNDLFSIQSKQVKSSKAVFLNKRIKQTKFTFGGCPHCPNYRLEYKIGDIYYSLYLEWKSGYEHNDPSLDDFTRKKKIVMNTLRTKFEIQLKK